MSAHGVEPLFESVGQCGFPGTGQARKPDGEGILSHISGADIPGEVKVVPEKISVAGGDGFHGSARTGVVGDLVDQDQAAHWLAFFEGVQNDLFRSKDAADADLVLIQPVRGNVMSAVNVHLILDVHDGGVDHFGSQLQDIVDAGHQRGLVHPQERGGEAFRDGMSLSLHQYTASGNVDFPAQLNGHRLSCHSLLHFIKAVQNAGHRGGFSAGKAADLVAHPDASALNLALEATEGGVGTAYSLDRHGEFRAVRGGSDFNLVQIFQKRKSVIPGHPVGMLRDVVSGGGGNGDDGEAV